MPRHMWIRWQRVHAENVLHKLEISSIVRNIVERNENEIEPNRQSNGGLAEASEKVHRRDYKPRLRYSALRTAPSPLVYTGRRWNGQSDYSSLRNATPSVFHQRYIGRVLRSSLNSPGRRIASSRDRESQPGRCPPLWQGDLRNDGGSVPAAGADGSDA